MNNLKKTTGNKNTFLLDIPYGMFTKDVFFNQDGVLVKGTLAHKKGLEFLLIKKETGFRIPGKIFSITGRTPKTYYSGNREYGKIIIEVPQDVEVSLKKVAGHSNDEAFELASALGGLIIATANAEAFVLLFYFKNKKEEQDAGFETLNKLQFLEFVNIKSIPDEVFIRYAMPVNLKEIFPSFPFITQGWKNMEKYSLFAIERVNGINVFIPFAFNEEEDIQTVYNYFDSLDMDVQIREI